MKKRLFFCFFIWMFTVLILPTNLHALAELSVRISCPQQSTAGEELKEKIEVFITNSDDRPAEKFSLDLVLSADRSISIKFAAYSPNFSDDALLQGGREFIQILEPGKTIKVKLNGPNRIPNDTSEGICYLGAVVDPGNVVLEGNKRNSIAICQLKIEKPLQPDNRLPDLIVF